MKEMKKVLNYEELDHVHGGYAGVDDFIKWVSEQTGKFLKHLWTH